MTCYLHNVIIGKLWFEYAGTMEILCIETGLKSVIHFKPYSWFTNELNRIEGFIIENCVKKRALYGFWTHCFYSCNVDEYESITKSAKLLPMVQMDENFNEIEPIGNEKVHLLSEKKHSFSDLLNLFHMHKNSGSNEKEKLTNNDLIKNTNQYNNQENSDDKQAHQDLSRIHNGTLPNDYYLIKQLDLFEIWRVLPRPKNASDYYSFNYFTLCLNELKEEYKHVIAPTDSRYRTDVRALEYADFSKASEEKNRLEEKQREAARLRCHEGAEYTPKWFDHSKDPDTLQETWTFNKKYWERNFSDCPDLF